MFHFTRTERVRDRQEIGVPIEIAAALDSGVRNAVSVCGTPARYDLVDRLIQEMDWQQPAGESVPLS